MPEDITERQTQLIEDLEELIAQLSQQADIRANATQIYAEDIEKKAEQREKKRWSIFVAVVTSVIVGITLLGFETWERHYERLSDIQERVIKIEEAQSYIKKHMIGRFEFDKKILEVHKLRNHERQEALKELRKELREEMEKLQQRKKEWTF